MSTQKSRSKTSSELTTNLFNIILKRVAFRTLLLPFYGIAFFPFFILVAWINTDFFFGSFTNTLATLAGNPDARSLELVDIALASSVIFLVANSVIELVLLAFGKIKQGLSDVVEVGWRAAFCVMCWLVLALGLVIHGNSSSAGSCVVLAIISAVAFVFELAIRTMLRAVAMTANHLVLSAVRAIR